MGWRGGLRGGREGGNEGQELVMLMHDAIHKPPHQGEV